MYDPLENPEEEFLKDVKTRIEDLEARLGEHVQDMAVRYDGDLDGGPYYSDQWYMEVYKDAKASAKKLVFWREVLKRLEDDNA